MLNQLILVGRVKNIEELDNELKVILSVTRTYKNVDGEYEVDNIPCILWNNIATNIKEYCNIGDVVGIKGRIQEKEGNIQLIAEKVTFLSNKKKEEE